MGAESLKAELSKTFSQISGLIAKNRISTNEVIMFALVKQAVENDIIKYTALPEHNTEEKRKKYKKIKDTLEQFQSILNKM